MTERRSTFQPRVNRSGRIAMAVAVLAAILIAAPPARAVPVAGTVDFVLASSAAPEATTPHTVDVVLDVGAGNTLDAGFSVDVIVAAPPGTASGGGVDYTYATQTVTFDTADPDGTTRSISIAVTGDDFDEGDETIELELSNIVNTTGLSTIGAAQPLHQVTITDDDTAGVTVTPTTVSATEGGATGSYTVELDSVPTANVTVTVAGDAQASGSAIAEFAPGDWDTPKTVTVTAINDNVVEGAHGATITNTVTSADPNYDFSANSVAVNITDNDFSVAFVASSSAILEGDAGSSPAAVAVVLNTGGQSLTSVASVNVARTGGTATPGADFSFSSPETVTFPIGASDGTQRSVTVTVNGDTGNEPDETVILGLSAPSTGGSIVSPVAHTLTISNDDVEPGLSVLNAAPVLEGPAAELSFTVILEPASGQIVTVNYATANGTAEEPSDYAAVSDTLTFQPGETIKEVLVAVAQDGVDEIAETLFLNLSTPLNTTIADAQGVGTILDIDNVAPLVGPLTTADLVGTPGFEFAPGQTVKLTGTFTDPGLADTHTVLVDWGDGTASTLIPITPIGSRTFEATHVYADAGFFQITVRADDADGGSSGERLAFVTVSGSAIGGGDDTVGLVDVTRGVWRLYDGAGVMATEFFYGNPGDIPFMGDWDGDGIDTPGLYRQSDGFVYLRNLNSQGNANIRFFFGNPGDVPIAGDFNNDGKDTVSIYRPSNQTFYIINKLGANDGGLGPADFSYVFGDPGDNPYTGDFDGDGWDTVGLHRESTGLVYFLNLHQQGNAAHQFIFGDPGDQIISGDWTGDGIDTPALYRSSDQTFYFRFTNTQGPASASFFTGLSGWTPVSGNTGL